MSLPQPAAVAIRGLTKRYRDFVAVEGLDLEVPAGQLYALLGRNGAGKTTTIKCMAGLLRPTAGRILIGGVDVVAEPRAAKLKLGYVPDRPFLYEKLSGAEFVGFMAELYAADAVAVERLTRHYMDIFELSGWEGQLIETYSYGMRQKLVLASVFARDPEVLVIDEPIVGLDPRAAKRLRDVLLELSRAGKAILMSTHSVQVAELVADRIGIIERGGLIAEGTLEELRARAELPGSSLEEVFLALTAPDEPSLAPTLTR